VAVRGDELVELEGTVPELLSAGLDAIRRAVDAATVTHPLDLERLGPAVPDPGKVLCAGRNYADHAAELGNVTTTKPDIFMRARTSLTGPYAPLVRPRVSERMDWEVELAVVIGRGGRYIDARRAMDHVAGYAVFNDVSFRDFQRFATQWIPGKNFDGSGPLGPFLVTADEVPDPFQLDLSCVVIHDGVEEEVQRSNTSLMVHPIPTLIAYCSQWTTLEPGDVIATGTPGGVGDARDPKRY